MDPFRLAEAVTRDYRSYLRSAFPIHDERLRGLLDERIEHQHLLWKGPYVGLSPDYRPGKKAADIAGLDARIVAKFASWTLHVHQVRAIERLVGSEPAPTLVATGTGSGKTEAFFLPLLDYCLRARDRGERGIKALLLYPLTALTNDQFKRFRRYLEGTGVTIGRYTAETPREKAQRDPELPAFVRGTREEIWEDPPDILMCHPKMLELLLTRPEDREQMFAEAPLRWLVVDEVHTCTGTFGAELALLVRRLRAVTERAGDRDLVCIGTSATLQRDHHGQVPEPAYEKLCRFATKLFGCWFGGDAAAWRQAVVTEELAEPPAPEGEFPPAVEISDADLAMLASGPDADVERVADRMIGARLSGTGELGTRLADRLERHPAVCWLRRKLQVPRTVEELVAEWRTDVPGRTMLRPEDSASEIRAWLLLGSRAVRHDVETRSEVGRVLRPRLHLFVRGLQHLRRCTNPECGALVERGQPVCGACGSLSRPLKICRHCGQDYFGLETPGELPLRGGDLHPLRDEGAGEDDDPEDDEGAVPGPDADEEEAEVWPAGPLHMAWTLHDRRGAVELADVQVTGDDEEDDAEAEDPAERRKVGLRPLWYCTACGHGRVGGGAGRCTNPACRRADLVRAWAFSGRPIVCPACAGRYGTKEVVTPLATGAAAAVSTITSSVVEHLEPAWRKVLIFADSRQEAAFQAGYLEDKHEGFVRRQVVMRELLRRSEMPLTHAAEYVLDRMVSQHIVDDPANKDERRDKRDTLTWQLLVEFARRTTRRVNLEGLGLVRVRYEGLDDVPRSSGAAGKIKDVLGIDDETCARLLGAFLDEMRTRRAVDHPFLCSYLSPDNDTVRRLDLTVAAFEKRPVGYVQTVGAHGSKQDSGKPYGRRGWWPAKGAPGAFERLVAGLMPESQDDRERKAQRERAREVIALVVEALSHPGGTLQPFIRVEDIGSSRERQPAWMVNHRRVVLAPALEGATTRCGTCRTVMGHPVGSRCVQYLCEGRLVPFRAPADDYYVAKYTTADPVAIRTAEHTGQIEGRVRARIERDFLEGKIQALACTPTMDLGVDIGDLAALVLRNVPPLAANYAQRAGRAGRSGARVALIVTYCAITPHDQNFYDHPSDVIRGRIDPPDIAPDNPALVARHVRALALEQVTTRRSDRLQIPTILRRWLSGTTPAYVLTGDGPLSQAIIARAEQIGDRAKKVFEADRKRLDMGWFDRLLEEVVPRTGEAIHVALQEVVDELNILLARLNELVAEGPAAYEGSKAREIRQLQARTIYLYGSDAPRTGDRGPRNLYPLGYLGESGVLPGYALPGVRIRCFTDRQSELLARGAEIGIAEYAPGNTIYMEGRKLVVVGLLGGFDPTMSPGAAGRAERGTAPYRVCRHCDVLVLRPDRGTCEWCREELADVQNLAWLRATRARADVHITSSEEGRAHDRYELRMLLPDRDARGRTFEHVVHERAPFTLRHFARVPVYLVNQGHKKRSGGVLTFRICPECGLAEQPYARDPERILELHQRARCPGAFTPVHLAAKLDVEALTVTVPRDALVVGWDELRLREDDPEDMRAAYAFDDREEATSVDPVSAALAVREVLLAGSRQRLAAREGELRGFERLVHAPPPDGVGEPPVRAVEVVLYDATPGGSGLIGRIVRDFAGVAEAGRDALEGCTCHVRARSCYGCLRRYGNQRMHDVLDRRLAIAFGKRLVHTTEGEVREVLPEAVIATAAPLPAAEPVVPAMSIEPDRQAMERRFRELFIASGIPVRYRDAETGDPVVRGHPKGANVAVWPDDAVLDEQHRIQLPGGRWTIADFAYASRKCAIYCDGATFHAPTQATANWKRDLEITNDLQDEGWRVSRYTWDDLEDGSKVQALLARTRKWAGQ